MGVYMRPADLARQQAKRFAAMKLSQVAAHKELVQAGTEDHFSYVSGGLSESTLKAMGHPFAREGASSRGIVGNKKKFKGSGRGFAVSYTDKQGAWKSKKVSQVSAKGSVNPLPINVQSGQLRRTYFRRGPSGGQKIVHMGFSAPHASAVLSPRGTKHMIYRGFYSKSRHSTSTSDLGIIAKRHRARSAALIQVLRAKQRKTV